MSSALVHKGIELVDINLDAVKEGIVLGKRKTEKNKGVFDLIPPEHRIVRTIGKKGKREHKNLLSRTSKLTITEARKSITQRGNQTEENIRRLQLLSSSKLNSETALKLLDRAVNRRVVEQKETEPVEESTVFTEEDFEKFEKEYFLD